MAAQNDVVSTDWLSDNLHASNQRIVDCSWYLPELKRDAHAEYLNQHVPGAVRFDIDEIADHTGLGAHMLPSAEGFADKVGRLGIDNRTRVVVYDTNYVSARVWWMFQVFGHDDVVILDGGLTKWLAEGRPVESGEVGGAPREFVVHKRSELVADWREVLDNLSSRRAQLVDARTAKRFSGELPTGYPGIAPGHVPGSINLPWDTIENPQTRQFLPEMSWRAASRTSQWTSTSPSSRCADRGSRPASLPCRCIASGEATGKSTTALGTNGRSARGCRRSGEDRTLPAGDHVPQQQAAEAGEDHLVVVPGAEPERAVLRILLPELRVDAGIRGASGEILRGDQKPQGRDRCRVASKSVVSRVD